MRVPAKYHHVEPTEADIERAALIETIIRATDFRIQAAPVVADAIIKAGWKRKP